MIYQISPIKTKTEALPQINKGLLQARHIQARLKQSQRLGAGRIRDLFFKPTLEAVRVMPVTRWVE